MGGKDVVHLKQLQNSNLQPVEVQKLLKKLADEKFCEDGAKDVPTADTSSGKSKVRTWNTKVRTKNKCTCKLFGKYNLSQSRVCSSNSR